LAGNGACGSGRRRWQASRGSRGSSDQRRPRLTWQTLKARFRKISFRDYVELTDPAVIRALAHPTRMTILAYLFDGPATATECSTAAEQSPSSCSYHLRTLAKLGFVEEVNSNDGRERRWRIKVSGHGIPKRAHDSPQVQAAARLWGRQWVAIEQRILSEFLAGEAHEPGIWRKAATFSSHEVHLTPDEVTKLGEQFTAMLEQFLDRTEPENRPAASRPVHFTLTAFPRPEAADRRRRATAGKKGSRDRSI
jgi:DNA-binding transcriptional ArsR family regulator